MSEGKTKSAHAPNGVPANNPSNTGRSHLKSTSRQTPGSIQALAKISIMKTSGTTVFGGKIQDIAATHSAENPKPKNPRAKAAPKTADAQNANAVASGIQPPAAISAAAAKINPTSARRTNSSETRRSRRLPKGAASKDPTDIHSANS